MAIRFAKEFGWPRNSDLPLAYDFKTLNGQPAAKAPPPGPVRPRLRAQMGHLPVISELLANPFPQPRRWGPSQSRHMQADAADFGVAMVDSFGQGRFDKAADPVCRNGGFGTYEGGSRHVDSRGSKARWSSL
jgi:hypothetical protein